LLHRRFSGRPNPRQGSRARGPGRGPDQDFGDTQRSRRRAGPRRRRPLPLAVHARRQRPARVGGSDGRQPAVVRDLHRLQVRSCPRRDPDAQPQVALMSEWTLIIGRDPGLLTWTLLVVCVGLALFEAALPLLRRTSRSRAERRATPAILGLRVIAIAALVAMVLELAVRVETFTGAARRVVVLVDRSASMDLA